MIEQTYGPDETSEPSDARENTDMTGLDTTGRDRSADYNVDQAQAHRNADEGREMPYTTSDPG